MLKHVSMYDEILYAITTKLDQMYNQEQEEVKIYTDHVRQGLQVPCFFVRFLEVSQKEQIHHQFSINIPVVIQYLAEEDPTLRKGNIAVSTEHNKVVTELYENLRILEIRKDIKLRGMQMRHDTDGETLNFFAQYKCHAMALMDKTESMGQLQMHIH